MFRIFVTVLLVFNIGFTSFSCTENERDDFNPFSDTDEEEKEAFNNFVKLWLLLVATAQATMNNPPSWFPSSVDAEQARAEWNKLSSEAKAEACTYAFASGENPPAEFCSK